MKVLLINKFHYIKGGSETYYFGLGELLKKQGHQVIWFSMKDEKNVPCEQERYFVEHVDYNKPMAKTQMVKAGLKMLYSLEAKKNLEQLIKAEKPDIAHLNIFQTQLTASVVDVLHKYHIPIVYTMHDLKTLCPCYTMMTHGEVCERCLKGNYLPCIQNRCMKDSLAKSILGAMEAEVYKMRNTYRKMDLIITPSAFYKTKEEQGQITDARIIHMPNFLPKDTEYATDYHIGEYYLYFGRLSKEKGILTLLEAYKRANVEKPLYIVGTGPIEKEVQEKIQALNLESKVHMLGFRRGEELKNLVKNSTCVILPSEWYENGPYTIMEAQAAGKPCIVSNYAGLPEIVEDGVTGYICEPKNPDSLCDCICRMDQLDSNRLIAMGKQAADRAREKFSVEKYGEQLLKEYQNLL